MLTYAFAALVTLGESRPDILRSCLYAVPDASPDAVYIYF
jgi:hypothetical protein